MNLVGNEINSNKKNNKTVTGIVVAIMILIVLAIILVAVINQIKAKTFKFYVDGKSTNVSKSVFVDQDGTRYINIKTIAELVGYEYNNGEYNNPYVEDKTKCYVKGNNEIASFISESSKMYKVVLDEGTAKDENNKDNNTSNNTANNTSNTNTNNTTKNTTNNTVKDVATTAEDKTENVEYFTLSNDIKLIDGSLYATEQGIKLGFNISFSYNEKNNRIDIYSLDYLSKYYSGKIANSVLDDTCEFSNKKLLMYNMALVKNSEGDYGVSNLTGESIIGTKYKKIKFIESSNDFIVTTENNKQGILSLKKSGAETEVIVKISPQYDEIKQLDKDLDLFLVKDNNKYGVINGAGKIIVYIEYDKIGIDITNFVNNEIDNPYILYQKYIPVMKDAKWGIIDTSGNITLNLEYDALGCTQGISINKTENNVLLIPDVKGIVVYQNGLYGVMNITGTKLVPTAVQEIYKVSSSGVNTYYMTYNNEKIDLVNWIKAKQNQQ